MRLSPVECPTFKKPYSTGIGEFFKLPKSPYLLRLFPTYGEIVGGAFFELPVQRAISMTVTVDFSRARLMLRVFHEKGVSDFTMAHIGLELLIEGRDFSLKMPLEKEPYLSRSHAKIHFGVHKKADLAALEQRLDLTEWLPIWHAFGNMVVPGKVGRGANWDLLEKEQWKELLISSREGLWVPHEKDFHHLGWSGPLTLSGDADLLLSMPSEWIEKSLAKDEDKKIFISPFTHSGRAKELPTPYALVDLHWRSHALLKASFKATCNETNEIHLPKPFRTARLWAHGKSFVYLSGSPLALELSTVYYLDRFEK